jgi:hypothetical protein
MHATLRSIALPTLSHQRAALDLRQSNRYERSRVTISGETGDIPAAHLGAAALDLAARNYHPLICKEPLEASQQAMSRGPAFRRYT